jgi:tRNA A58 N-methylase Trm61
MDLNALQVIILDLPSDWPRVDKLAKKIAVGLQSIAKENLK